MAKATSIEDLKALMKSPKNIRNICTSAHIHHGKTALTDNLLAAAGMMSEKSAGNLEDGMATWQHKDEQERLMTVDAANVSMSHDFEGETYLINLIDTPGHVDFGGNVTRAMRAIDGTVVLICGVEGIMPQTETVVKQAIRERVRPVLFINKVDRMINELKLTPEQIQERFIKLIMDFNKLVENVAEEEFKQKWKVNIMDGSVAFGSARENWGLSLPFMKKKNITFKQIIEQYVGGKSKEEAKEWFWKNAPLFEVILDMVIKHLPTPLEAQRYRIPHIWKGDLQSPFGQDLLNTNSNGKPAFVITRIVIDPKLGREIAAGRLFSGTIREGMQVWLNNAKQYQRIGQVFLYKGIKPEQIGEAVAGNVIALGGVSGYAGETVTLEPEVPFEDMKHIFEPVITKSIEPMKPQDLPKLVEILKKVSKEDPSLKVTINLETGENLIHGMGELHLEIIENRIRDERGFQVKTGEPIVVYRETVQKLSAEQEGKSPNKHNKFYIKVEALSKEWQDLVKDNVLTAGKMKKGDSESYLKLEKAGIPVKEAKKIRDVYESNVLVDDTKGVVAISEVQELINEGFEQVMREGPLAREPCVNIKVIITDCKLHEDAIHRGPAQVLPAIREGIKAAMVDAKAVLFEPYQIILIECPGDFVGEISKLVSNKRGQLLEVEHKGVEVFVRSRLPVSEMIGLASDLRSATEGRGTYYIVDQEFDKVPAELQEKTMKKIRTRKGLNPDQMNLS
ncbi:MAG: elongation factor EF-2 [Nanoarchaeota archaeon]|nr:elongation factor EF-2 [Nanoarchaeota archaeon]